MNIVEHDETGRIISVINYPTSDQRVTEFGLYQDRLFLPQGSVVELKKDYILDGELTRRPEMQATFDGRFLKGVPKGASINIDGDSYEADGSDSIEIEFDENWTYRIRIFLWPYLDKEFLHEDLAQK